MQNITAHAFRLKPGQDLKKGIKTIVDDLQIKAGWISTCVGSLPTIPSALPTRLTPAAKPGILK